MIRYLSVQVRITIVKSSLKVFIVSLLCFAPVFAANNSANTPKIIKLNIQKSFIDWTGRKVLGQHSGKVGFQSGEFHLNNGKLAGGIFIIDMTSIRDTDLSDKDYNKKLVTHLKSPDFFNVEGFPTATLKITRVLKLINKANSYQLTGDLTIKGITNSITFPASFMASGKGYEGNAQLSIDRTKWDVQYGSSNFFEGLGDKAIKNEIELSVHVFSE